MLFLIDAHSGIPIFRQLMEQVKLHVASGRLAPGDALPSIRSLAVPLGVNPMTISKAYNLLEREGVLERRPGRPLVVAAIAADSLHARRLERLRAALAPVCDLTRELGVESEETIALLRRMFAEDCGGERP